MGARFVVVVLFATACSSSRDDELTRGRCEQLRDHLIDVRLADGQITVDREAHRAAMKRAIGEGFITTCLEKMTVPQVRCALDAHDSAGVDECSRSASAQTATK